MTWRSVIDKLQEGDTCCIDLVTGAPVSGRVTYVRGNGDEVEYVIVRTTPTQLVYVYRDETQCERKYT